MLNTWKDKLGTETNRRSKFPQRSKHLTWNTVKPTKYINHFANDMVVRPLDSTRSFQSGFDIIGHDDKLRAYIAEDQDLKQHTIEYRDKADLPGLFEAEKSKKSEEDRKAKKDYSILMQKEPILAEIINHSDRGDDLNISLVRGTLPSDVDKDNPILNIVTEITPFAKEDPVTKKVKDYNAFKAKTIGLSWMQGTPDDATDDYYDIKEFSEVASENNFFDIHNFEELEANQTVKTFHFNPSGFNNSGSIVTISNDGAMQDYEINRLKDSIFLNKDGADNPQKDEYPFLAPEENEYRLALKDQWNLLVSIKQTEVDNEFEFDIIYTIRNWHHCDGKYAQNPQDVIWSRLRSIVVCMAPKSSDCIYERHLGYLRSGRR